MKVLTGVVGWEWVCSIDLLKNIRNCQFTTRVYRKWTSKYTVSSSSMMKMACWEEEPDYLKIIEINKYKNVTTNHNFAKIM